MPQLVLIVSLFTRMLMLASCGKPYQVPWDPVPIDVPPERERSWVVVERGCLAPENQTVHIDPDTIRREGTRETLCQLTDYKMMQGNVGFSGGSHRFFSMNTQKQFDCMNKRVRLLAYEEFSGHMGIGQRDGGYVDQDKWLAVEPESVNQAFGGLVCASPAQPAAREHGVPIAAAPPVRRHIAQRRREWAAGIVPSHPLRAVRSAGVLDETDDGYHKNRQAGGSHEVRCTRRAM